MRAAQIQSAAFFFFTTSRQTTAAFLAQKHNVNLYFEGITKRPEKCMHKRTRITQSAAARVTHRQMPLVGKASRIVSQTVGMARAKYFPSLFKDPALSSTVEEKTKKNNIRRCRELRCHESVMGGRGMCSFLFLVAMAKHLTKDG